jgi:hypothetical protein
MAKLLACCGRMVRLFAPEGEMIFVEAGWVLLRRGLELGALTMFSLCRPRTAYKEGRVLGDGLAIGRGRL